MIFLWFIIGFFTSLALLAGFLFLAVNLDERNRRKRQALNDALDEENTKWNWVFADKTVRVEGCRSGWSPKRTAECPRNWFHT